MRQEYASNFGASRKVDIRHCGRGSVLETFSHLFHYRWLHKLCLVTSTEFDDLSMIFVSEELSRGNFSAAVDLMEAIRKNDIQYTTHREHCHYDDH